MLDVPSSMLPNNSEGVRTTHTCELCGFEPKTKNKYREKQDHLVMKHFKEKIDKLFPHARPYACPVSQCAFTGKDKQALLRHYTGKHGILEKFLREALAEKGIHYNPHENGKRRHSDASGGGKAAKAPKLNGQAPQQQKPVTTIKYEPVKEAKVVTISSKPNTEELRKEVEAMLRSFQPVSEQPVIVQQASSNESANESLPTMVDVSNLTPVPTTSMSSSSSSSSSPLPAFVLSAVANATAASVAAKSQNQTLNTISSSRLSTNGNTSTTNATTDSKPIVPSQTNAIPIPIEMLANGNQIFNVVNGHQGGQTAILVRTSGGNLIDGENIIWSAVPSSTATVVTDSTSRQQPAVVVEAAQTLPVTFIECDASTLASAGVMLENIDYDYLYQPASNGTTEVRQLDFCML